MIYALLDGASVTGAYEFTIHCEEKRVVMAVENQLFTRNKIRQLGIASMTSMFSCGTNERRMCNTYHPQIHDSIRSPSDVDRQQRMDCPRGFGLLQLNHDFKDYQDVIGWYDKRPSLWVEPIDKWGKGTIHLMEIPTTSETLNNIVCFWQPSKPVTAGSEFNFQYELYWSQLPPVCSDLARVDAARTGIGGFPEGWAPGEHFLDQVVPSFCD